MFPANTAPLPSQALPAVLLVDDEEQVLRGLARVLWRQPYRIFTTRSGSEAINVLKSRKIHVVVCDEQMPDMSGTDLLAWVAAHLPEVGRIVLTGHPSAESAITAINRAQVYRYFLKPCDPVALALAICEILEQQRLRDSGLSISPQKSQNSK